MEVLSNWLARQTVNLFSSELVGSSPTTSTISTVAQWLVHPTVSRKVAGSNPVGTAIIIWGYNNGSLPALDAGGYRFESCSPDKLLY